MVNIELLEKYKNYVCPNCFNILGQCKCGLKPYHLIMIDSKVQESVRILNEKGYITTGSCESHKEICLDIYISFNRNYNFETLPDGFIYDKNKYAVVYKYRSKKDIENQKEQKLFALLEWCKSLANLK